MSLEWPVQQVTNYLEARTRREGQGRKKERQGKGEEGRGSIGDRMVLGTVMPRKGKFSFAGRFFTFNGDVQEENL